MCSTALSVILEERSDDVLSLHSREHSQPAWSSDSSPGIDSETSSRLLATQSSNLRSSMQTSARRGVEGRSVNYRVTFATDDTEYEETESLNVSDSTPDPPNLREQWCWLCQHPNSIKRWLMVFFFEVLPYVCGGYLIFYNFKEGNIGLGFTALLMLLFAHGILKFFTAKYKRRNGRNSGGHDDSDSLDGAGSTLRGMNGDVEEPPPPYSATTPPLHDSRGLEVHLTPQPRLKSGGLRSNIRKVLNSFRNQRQEVSDNSLPSYSDAIKNVNKTNQNENLNSFISIVEPNSPMRDPNAPSKENDQSLPLVTFEYDTQNCTAEPKVTSTEDTSDAISSNSGC